MKIEVGKIYKSRFKNALADNEQLVEVEKVVSCWDGLEIKLKSIDKTCPMRCFESLFKNT